MKEHLKYCLRNFFIIVTLINVAMFIVGMICAPDQKFGYEAFLYPLIYGLIGSIPNLIFVQKKEPTILQYLIRRIVGVILIIVALLAFMFAGREITKELAIVASAVSASVVVTYILVELITWILDSKVAKDMNADLQVFQKSKGAHYPVPSGNIIQK